MLIYSSVFYAVTVDSYTDQDWKKLQAAVDALKSPVFQDNIELDPSAIGQYLHTGYVHSLSTPNIHDLQLDTTVSETELMSPPHPSSFPSSSTLQHSFPNYALVGPAAATDQIPRKTRMPSMRSIRRQRIVSMAEAGDVLISGNSSKQTTRPGSTMSSIHGSPVPSGRSSHVETPTLSPNRRASSDGVAMKKKKRKKGERSRNVESSTTLPTSANTSAVELAKNLNQGVIVYENGKYKNVTLG